MAAEAAEAAEGEKVEAGKDEEEKVDGHVLRKVELSEDGADVVERERVESVVPWIKRQSEEAQQTASAQGRKAEASGQRACSRRGS
eukprot:6534859-Prymnesium_polylepis.2